MASDPRKIASEYRSLSEIMMDDGRGAWYLAPNNESAEVSTVNQFQCELTPVSHKFRLRDLKEPVVVKLDQSRLESKATAEQ